MLKDKAAAEKWDALMLLDAGDLFHDKFKWLSKDSKYWVATANFIVDQFNRSGCLAITLGDRDLRLPPSLLKKLHKKARFPFLVANLLDEKTGKPVFGDRIIHEAAGIKIGIFGVTMESSLVDSGEGKPAWQIKDPTEIARGQVSALREAGATVVIMLAHLPENQARALAKSVPGITAILAGNGARASQSPKQVQQSFFMEVGSKGKHLGMLSFHLWQGKEQASVFVNRGSKAAVQTKIAQLQGQMTRYQRMLERTSEEAPNSNEPKTSTAKLATRTTSKKPGNKYYKKQLVRVQAELQQAKMELDDTKDVDANANFISYELAAVRKSLTDEPVIGKAVTEFRKKYPKLAPKKAKRPLSARPLAKKR